MEYLRVEHKNIKVARVSTIVSGASMLSNFIGLGILTPILSPVAIIFAFLSKGKTKKLSIASNMSILTSLLAVVFFIFSVVFMTYNMLYNNEYRRYFRDTMNTTCHAFYGMSYFEYTEELDKELAQYDLSIEKCEDTLDAAFRKVGLAPMKRY